MAVLLSSGVLHIVVVVSVCAYVYAMVRRVQSHNEVEAKVE